MLESLLTGGKATARSQTHARILLKADQAEGGPGWTDEQIAEALSVGRATVERVRKRFVEGGLLDALVRRPQPERPQKRKMDGELEARLVTLACSQTEGGQKRWTMRMLAEKLVQLGYIDQISHNTVWVTPKKNELKPWRKKPFCIPPEANAECVYHMEDVLEVYQRPYDPRVPKMCMDEGSKQVLAHTRKPIPMEAGEPERVDDEYERKGVCSVFLAMEPETGACQVRVSKRRTKKDWALFLRDVIDLHYPHAEKIVLVMDNLNTHTPSSFYEVFEPAEARRLTEKLEIHYTPKHGSWLNMAEIELSVLARQCLSDRFPNMQALTAQVDAWQQERNQAKVTINWRFTTADARIKLKRLYPSIEA
nr:IS630 family transposase [Ktedonobacter racemifer]